MSRGRNLGGCVTILILVITVFFFFSLRFAVGQGGKPKAFKPKVLQKQSEPVSLFSTLDHGNVYISPPVVTIRYGQDVLRLDQGGTGSIQIPEESHLIDSQGRVSVTIEYTLKNRGAKAFRFNIDLLYARNHVERKPEEIEKEIMHG